MTICRGESGNWKNDKPCWRCVPAFFCGHRQWIHWRGYERNNSRAERKNLLQPLNPRTHSNATPSSFPLQMRAFNVVAPEQRASMQAHIQADKLSSLNRLLNVSCRIERVERKWELLQHPRLWWRMEAIRMWARGGSWDNRGPNAATRKEWPQGGGDGWNWSGAH